jgi:hypothetical protein
MRHAFASFTVASVVLAALALSAPSAQAAGRKPEDVFGGRVVVSDKSFPLESKSPQAYIASVKKQSKDRFMEDKEKGQWKIYYAAFFKKPLNDLEVKCTVYDVTDGSQRFIDSWDEYLAERNQRVIIGNVKLKRQDGKVNPNSKIMIVMESHGSIVATASFYIIGEAKKFSGKVEFSEDEAKQKGDTDEGDADQDAAKAAEEKKAAEPKKKGGK